MRGRGFIVLMVFLAVGGLAQPEQARPVRVARVVDGDTVVLLGSHETVRYLGVDTPEAGEPFYQAATRINRALVLRRDVYLELGHERRDAYGRLLAYLWVRQDGEWLLVNEELLRRGVARLYVFWPAEEKYYERFLRAVTLAQVEKRGLWGKFKEPLSLSTVEEDPVLYLTEAVTVAFTAGQVQEAEDGWRAFALGSRYGFHLLVRPEVWPKLKGEWLVGRTVYASGELRWERLQEGPFIEVLLPEQLGWGD